MCGSVLQCVIPEDQKPAAGDAVDDPEFADIGDDLDFADIGDADRGESECVCTSLLLLTAATNHCCCC